MRWRLLGSILSMPYAMLSGVVPAQKMGVGMGFSTCSSCFPRSLLLWEALWLNNLIFGGDIVYTMVLAGLSLIVASLNLLLAKNEGF